MKSAAHIQAGVEGNQSVMIMAAPVNSLPSATVHVSQYRMAVTQAAACVHMERAGQGHGNAQLAQAQHDEVHDGGSHRIGQDRADRAGLTHRVTG